MLAARLSVIRVAKLFDCSRVIVHSFVRRYKQTGISIDAPRLGNVMQRHREPRLNEDGAECVVFSDYCHR